MIKKKPAHLNMSEGCFQTLLHDYSQLPNPRRCDYDNKLFLLRSLGCTEEEIAQICKEKEIPPEQTMREIMEYQEMELRRLARMDRKLEKEKRGIVIGVGAKALFKLPKQNWDLDQCPDVVRMRQLAEQHKSHVQVQKSMEGADPAQS